MSRAGASERARGGSRAAMRRAVFLAQEAVVLCTTIRALRDVEVLERSLGGDRSLAELRPGLSEAGFGSLRIGIRTLAAEGWLAEGPTLDPATTVIRWTEAGRLAARHHASYAAIGDLLATFDAIDDDAWTREWTAEQVAAFAGLVDRASERWGLDGDLPDDLATLVRTHLDTALLVPTMLWLHVRALLGEGKPTLPEDELGAAMRRLLGAVGFLERGEWTDSGLQARAYALNFGGVATYLPMLARLPEMYRGELTVSQGGEEWHVHRKLNVTIAAKAHHRYFGDSDPVFVDLFERPEAERPRFIADMGCGDGSWLAHLHGILSDRLEDHPRLIGIDASPAALDRARATLAAAGAPALLIEGDVTDPDRLRRDLAAEGIAIEDGLHVRAFLDHDRTYLGADSSVPAPGLSSGAYIDANGGPIAPQDVERDLVAHLRRWAPHVAKHGMVVLETHCVSPEVTRDNLGAMHSVAFDAYQAYSLQYPVEYDSFLGCCREAGLRPERRYERVYPSNAPFVTVSLNRLLA